ncbi:MAG TPA: glycosyltransferase family 4 protein [Candidatus Nanopelagicales bacterium]|nr:glycosyltransferase family 4 protein [Candidatus Nanopelagicales bacterium]
MHLHALLPDLVDDARHPSGGSLYDRRVLAGLAGGGWSVHEHVVVGPWPWAPPESLRELRRTVAEIPDGATVLVDGIIASSTPDILLPSRFRLVVLLHLPLGETFPSSGDVASVRRAEQAVLGSAAAVVVTSTWTRRRVLARYDLDPQRVHVAEPGADPAPATRSEHAGRRLVQLAPLTALKGQDVLLDALDRLRDLDWSLRLVGARDLEPEYADGLQAALASFGDRIGVTGALGRDGVAAELAGCDLLVVPSRTETYGMAVTEALSRAVPVVAARVGGLPATLDRGGELPGTLVAPDDPAALAAVLRGWLTDETLRARWRAAARARRPLLHGWDATASAVDAALRSIGGRPSAVAR